MQSRIAEQDINILFVEDDKIDQMAFERFLRINKLDYKYVILDSIVAAEAAVKENHFDIAIVDYQLSDGTGLELVEKIKDIPVIFVTGHGDQKIAVQVMKAGVYDYLVKDPNRNYLEMLPITIENAINHKRDRDKLEEVEKEIEKLMWVLSNTDNLLAIAAADGKIEWVNQGFEKLTGYTFAEVAGTYGDILSKDTLPGTNPASEHYKEMMRTQKSVSYESKNYTKNGKEYWVFTTLTPIIDRKGKVRKIIAVDSEITEKKEVELQLIKSREEALHLAKVKEEFLANMSHEIRTPMNAIVGMVQLLSETDLSEKQKKYLDYIHFASDNLLTLINNILDVSKIEAKRVEFEKIPFSLKNTIEKLIGMMRPKIDEKGLEINLVISPDIPDLIIGDPFRLNQIIMNMISNSVKFTEKGGITLEVIVGAETDEDVTINFNVIDTGIGISKENQAKIFEHFTQAESNITRKYGGSGLGLTIVKKLIEKQGGSINIESEPGKGTRFYFDLKFQKAKPVQGIQNEEKQKTDAINVAGKTVLLVEDNELNTIVASEFLEKSGLIVEHAENGKIAVNMAKEKCYDFILMDIQMPEMDGYSAAKKIREDSGSPNVSSPIVAMTAHAMQGEREKCISAGMNDYITKPLKKDKLVEILINTLNAKK